MNSDETVETAYRSVRVETATTIALDGGMSQGSLWEMTDPEKENAQDTRTMDPMPPFFRRKGA